jgi:hypothetical protein
MAEQAAGLKCSSSYISLIELGKRQTPEDYPARFAEWISLSETEARELSELAFGKLSIIELASNDSERASIAEEFAKKFNILPIERLRELRRFLVSPTAPSPYSPAEISARAELARSVFNPDDRSYVDILKILENLVAIADPNFSLQVESFTDSDGGATRRVVASERIYQTAHQQNEHSRYALAHEFAHWLLHRHGTHAFYRLRPGLILSKNKAVELEADHFARQFLMPAALVMRLEVPEKLARQCGVPIGVAKIRVNEVCGAAKPDERERIATGLTALANQIGGAREVIPQAHGTEARQTRVIPFPQAATAAMVHRPRTHRLSEKNQTGDLFEYASQKENARNCKTTNRGSEWFKDNGWR